MLLLSFALKYLHTASVPNVPNKAAKPTTANVGTEAHIKTAPSHKRSKAIQNSFSSNDFPSVRILCSYGFG